MLHTVSYMDHIPYLFKYNHIAFETDVFSNLLVSNLIGSIISLNSAIGGFFIQIIFDKIFFRESW
jgi:hypothetical protein